MYDVAKAMMDQRLREAQARRAGPSPRPWQQRAGRLLTAVGTRLAGGAAANGRNSTVLATAPRRASSMDVGRR